MLNRFVVPALLFFFTSGVCADEVPRYAQELDKFTATAKSDAQEVRMRITVAGEVAQVEPSVRVGDLLLCASTRCYRAHTSGYVNMTNTAKGKAEVVADVSIPISTITDIYFTDVSATTTIKGHLTLEMPLAIDKAFPAVELMVGVRKQTVGTHTNYVPVQSASMYFTDESELVHYLPSMQTVAELSLGTKFTVPAGASDRPQIFNIGIAKVGAMFPKIDILPYINLKKAASVEVRAVRKASITHEPVVPITPAEPDNDARIVGAPTAQPSVRHAFYRTAVIEAAMLEKLLPGATSSESSSSSATAPPKSCSEYLAQPIVLGLINLTALQTGAARILACEKIPPFVHIVYVLLKDSRINFSIPYKPSNAGNGNGPNLSLQRIGSFGTTSANALINGFTWEGDYGLFEGDQGKALGIVRSSGVALGDNIQGGGANCASCATDKLQFVMAFSGDKVNPAFLSTRSFLDLGAFRQNVVSTTTSVINNGICQTPGSPSRWSAVGAFNGRMVLISSTTSGQTSAAELCAVFKALAIKDALRLDGGPSASLMVSGELLNPLDGWDRAKYGNSRRIAYPLRIGH